MVNNKVILMGRITKDAVILEPREEGQSKIAHFSLAVERMKKKPAQGEGGEEQTAYFFRCCAFEKQAIFLEQYGKKGVKFAIEGHLSSGSYEKDGNRISTTDVIVENIQFCESKKQSADGQGGDQFIEIPPEMESEMPFK